MDKIQSQPSIAPPELFNWEEKFGPEWSSESIPLEIFPGNDPLIRFYSFCIDEYDRPVAYLLKNCDLAYMRTWLKWSPVEKKQE